MEHKKKCKIINSKRFLPILMALALVSMPFVGINKAFAAITSGYTTPTYLSGTPQYPNRAIDSNLSTKSLLEGNSIMTFSIPAGSTKMNIWIGSDGSGLAAGHVAFNGPNGTTSPDWIVSGTSAQEYTLTIPSGTTGFTVSSTSGAHGPSYYGFDVFEIEVGSDVVHDNISGLTTSVSGQDVTLNWSIPSSNTHFTGEKIYRDGTLISNLSTTKATTYTDKSLGYGSNHTYKVTAIYDDGFETNGQTASASIKVTHDEIQNLTSSANKNVVTLNFTIPSSNGAYNGANVYRNGTLIGSTGTAATSFVDSNAAYDTDYTYKVTALYLDGYETAGQTVSLNIPSPKPVADVTGLTANATDKEIDLSFVPPNTDKLQTINIYRDGNLIGTTTGSSFTDKNVNPGTSYNYTVKTLSTDNVESQGVSLKVTTKAEQPPVFQGTFTQGPNGDYTVSWTQPTTGTVKIYMAGQTLASVPASNGSYVIPKANMKYTALGSPDVTVQPISESGLTGNKVSWPSQNNVNVPFSVTDLIQSGNGLFWLIAPFVLLALAFLLVPKLRRLLFSALGKMQPGKKEAIPGRRSKDESEKDPKEKQEREPRLSKFEREPIVKHEREPREARAARAQWEAAATKERENRSIRQSRMSQLRISRTQRPLREPRRTRETRAPRIPRERRGN